jgi:Fe-S oxidoreductase
MNTKRILLIYPYFYTEAKKHQLFPPLGIGILSAVLKKMGINAEILDCTFLTEREALEKASNIKPDITGIYVMSTLTKNALKLLDGLKSVCPESLYVTGGPLPTLYPAKFARVFDYVFKGEAAKSFPAFCVDYLEASNKSEFLKNIDPSRYPGIYGFKFGPVDSPAMHLSKEETDACPIPDRGGFDHKKFQKANVLYSGKKKAFLMLTYGCPLLCDFCSKPIFGDEVRFRSLDKVFEEIRDIVSYGYDSLWIADDFFTYDKDYLKKFCSRFIQEGLSLSWSCLSRVDSITEEIAMLMKSAGCSQVYLGIESGNDSILKLMNKKIDTATIKKGVEIFKRSKISCAGFFIVGYPGETIETIEETFAFALSLGLDEISFTVPYPLPGSKLYERVSDISEDDWSFESETRFLYKSEFNEKWLERRIQETNDQFEKMESAE